MMSKKSCENEVNLFSTAYNLKKIYNQLRKVGMNLEKTIKKFVLHLIISMAENHKTTCEGKFQSS